MSVKTCFMCGEDYDVSDEQHDKECKVLQNQKVDSFEPLAPKKGRKVKTAPPSGTDPFTPPFTRKLSEEEKQQLAKDKGAGAFRKYMQWELEQSTAETAAADPELARVAKEGLSGETRKPWEVAGYSETMDEVWMAGADAIEYVKWKQANGIGLPTPSPLSTPGAPQTMSDLLMQRVLDLLERQMGGGDGTTKLRVDRQTLDDVEVEWPEPRTATVLGKDGFKRNLDIPLEPIVIHGRAYTEGGEYTARIAAKLQEEILGAELVHVPYNAAFVRARFTLTSDDGKTIKEERRYVGPTFAPKSLAALLKKQIANLVELQMPGGRGNEFIEGTQTRYSDFSINGIKFERGKWYKLPPETANQLREMIKLHVFSYQELGKERKTIGTMGAISDAAIRAGQAEAIGHGGMTPNYDREKVEGHLG